MAPRVLTDPSPASQGAQAHSHSARELPGPSLCSPAEGSPGSLAPATCLPPSLASGKHSRRSADAIPGTSARPGTQRGTGTRGPLGGVPSACCPARGAVGTAVKEQRALRNRSQTDKEAGLPGLVAGSPRPAGRGFGGRPAEPPLCAFSVLGPVRGNKCETFVSHDQLTDRRRESVCSLTNARGCLTLGSLQFPGTRSPHVGSGAVTGLRQDVRVPGCGQRHLASHQR